MVDTGAKMMAPNATFADVLSAWEREVRSEAREQVAEDMLYGEKLSASELREAANDTVQALGIIRADQDTYARLYRAYIAEYKATCTLRLFGIS